MATKKKSTAKKPKSNPTPKPTSQKDLILVMVISILLGLGGGYLIGANTNSDTTKSTSSSMEESTTMHSHSSTYEVESENAPKVELVVVEDAKSGYNVKLITTDFVFTPENVNQDNVMGQGHAHVYVDGVKVSRLYGNYFHYPESFEGSKEFRVTLNANNHSEYAVDGEVIEAEVQVTHDADAEGHDASHSDSMKTEDDHMDGDGHSHSM